MFASIEATFASRFSLGEFSGGGATIQGKEKKSPFSASTETESEGQRERESERAREREREREGGSERGREGGREKIDLRGSSIALSSPEPVCTWSGQGKV